MQVLEDHDFVTRVMSATAEMPGLSGVYQEILTTGKVGGPRGGLTGVK